MSHHWREWLRALSMNAQRHVSDRQALSRSHDPSAIALATDIAAITCISNDYGFDELFARQVRAHGQKGDVAIAISTSGNSPNVLKGVEAAKACGLTTICWTGGTGGKLAGLVEYPFVVPSTVTARIQESHITLGHVLCELIEEQLLAKAS